MKLLTFPELKSTRGINYSRRHLRDLVKTGRFPKPVPVSEARIAWIEDEVDRWLAAKAAARDGAEPAEAPTPALQPPSKSNPPIYSSGQAASAEPLADQTDQRRPARRATAGCGVMVRDGNEHS